MYWARGTPARADSSAHSVRRLRSILATCVRGTSNIKHRPAVRTPPSKSVYIYIYHGKCTHFAVRTALRRLQQGPWCSQLVGLHSAMARIPALFPLVCRNAPGTCHHCTDSGGMSAAIGRNRPAGGGFLPAGIGETNMCSPVRPNAQHPGRPLPLYIIYIDCSRAKVRNAARRVTQARPPALAHSRPHSPLLRSSALLPSRPRSPPAAGCRS